MVKRPRLFIRLKGLITLAGPPIGVLAVLPPKTDQDRPERRG
jgi:hypothetical protein